MSVSPDPSRAREPRRRWHQRARHALRRSLGIRLLLLFLVVGLTMVLIFVVGSQRALGTGLRMAVAPLLSDYVDRIVAEVGTPPSIERARALSERLPLAIRITGPQVNWSSGLRAEDDDDAQWHGWRDGRAMRGAQSLLERETADGHRIRLGLGQLPWRDQPGSRGWIVLGLLLLVVALAYAYLRRLLRPLDDIRAGAARFGRGEFEQPIAVRRRDELGELAAQVNTMARDIHQMLEGKRGLLLAISHELRSPLTRARLNAELLPQDDALRPRREALLRDLEEMRELITDLLESERLSGSHVALQRERVDLVVLVREGAQAGAGAGDVVVEAPSAPAFASVDPARLRLALRNLVGNALRHGAGPRPPRVELRLQPDGVRLCVRDFGPGVDPAHLQHLAEAFYRPDTARTRAGGGVGLGLYLVRLVAQAHGGTLTLRNAQPGLEACLSIPARAEDGG